MFLIGISVCICISDGRPEVEPIVQQMRELMFKVERSYFLKCYPTSFKNSRRTLLLLEKQVVVKLV